MASVRVEVFVEPFKENAPGPHVVAIVDALEAAGLAAEMGPFATTAIGEPDEVAAAAAAMIVAGFEAGASAVQIRVEKVDRSGGKSTDVRHR